MKTFHILNGDCLAEQLKVTKINQDFIICRECLIDGNVSADNLSEFWKVRAKFISEIFGADDYHKKVVLEFAKIKRITKKSEANLKLFRVFPVIENDTDIWKGFGVSTTETLEKAFKSK
eukprot:gene24503-45275_t